MRRSFNRLSTKKFSQDDIHVFSKGTTPSLNTISEKSFQSVFINLLAWIYSNNKNASLNTQKPRASKTKKTLCLMETQTNLQLHTDATLLNSSQDLLGFSFASNKTNIAVRISFLIHAYCGKDILLFCLKFQLFDEKSNFSAE